MPKAIRLHENGGPDVLKWEDVDVGAPGEGEIQIRHTAAGLNFIDCYQRSGLYPMEMPSGLGMEGAGVVEAVGPGVTNFSAGQRIAYTGGPVGAYAEVRNLPAAVPIALPDSISDETGAAMMLKGLTVHMLLFKCYPVGPGDTILIHAAAGGVGTILCQWAKVLGATVIGTVGSTEKAALAKSNGCDHPINYREENFAERVKEITGGKGLPVVYDSIGKDTFEASLDCLENFGSFITFGNASGPIPPVEPLMLMQKGSIALSRPTLINYVADPARKAAAAEALVDVVSSGKVRIEIGQTFPMAEAAAAHTALESRQTTGSTILLP